MMSQTKTNDKAITEGYLAGGAALIVTILWVIYAPFHPLVIFIPFLISLVCLSLSTLWLLSHEKTIREWFISQPIRYIIVGIIEVIFIALYFTALYSIR